MRLTRLAAVLCLSLGLTLAAPAGAAPSETQQVNAALDRFVRSMDPDQRLIVDSVGLLNLTLRGAGLVANSESPPSPEWLAQWKAQVAQARASVKAQRDALPPFRPGDLGILAQSPKMARALPLIARLPDTARDATDGILATVDELVPLVEAAAGGDMAAMERMQVSVLSGLISNLVAQDALLDLTIAIGGDDHPQTALAEAVKAAHSAQKKMIGYRMAMMVGETRDFKSTLASARLDLAECRVAAARARPLAKAMAAQMAAAPLDADMKARFVGAFNSYGESADVEVAIADLIDRNLEGFMRGTMSVEGAQAFDRDLLALSDRRMKLQQQRANALRQ